MSKSSERSLVIYQPSSSPEFNRSKTTGCTRHIKYFIALLCYVQCMWIGDWLGGKCNNLHLTSQWGAFLKDLMKVLKISPTLFFRRQSTRSGHHWIIEWGMLNAACGQLFSKVFIFLLLLVQAQCQVAWIFSLKNFLCVAFLLKFAT